MNVLINSLHNWKFTVCTMPSKTPSSRTLIALLLIHNTSFVVSHLVLKINIVILLNSLFYWIRNKKFFCLLSDLSPKFLFWFLPTWSSYVSQAGKIVNRWFSEKRFTKFKNIIFNPLTLSTKPHWDSGNNFRVPQKALVLSRFLFILCLFPHVLSSCFFKAPKNVIVTPFL